MVVTLENKMFFNPFRLGQAENEKVQTDSPKKKAVGEKIVIDAEDLLSIARELESSSNIVHINGKRFEYRKRAPKLVDLPILLYETAPVQKVTGIIADWSILQASPEAVWTYSKTHSGLTADRFFGYYEGYDKAVAIRIYSVVPFKDSLELQTLNPELKRPPQSFCYVQSELDLPMKG